MKKEIEYINLFLLYLKKRKKYKLPEKFFGINLGSEYNTMPEYIGVDGEFFNFFNKMQDYTRIH